jgi:RNA polymerase sigma factor (sigma-70 family)
LVASKASPELLAAITELADDVEAWLRSSQAVERVKTLPERQRLILFLRSSIGLTTREIAKIVGVSRQMIDRDYATALKTLRTGWDADSPWE